mmetsp:Transcript_38180/g.43066  ORF Transcript_38180/g.43066 Transcript_38180/m.43066 type:complete len:127 (-) Transcript_38180:177-557(-)
METENNNTTHTQEHYISWLISNKHTAATILNNTRRNKKKTKAIIYYMVQSNNNNNNYSNTPHLSYTFILTYRTHRHITLYSNYYTILYIHVHKNEKRYNTKTKRNKKKIVSVKYNSKQKHPVETKK